MKKNNADKSAPYRTVGLGKITAPTPKTDEPKSVRITGKGDLRGGKKK